MKQLVAWTALPVLVTLLGFLMPPALSAPDTSKVSAKPAGTPPTTQKADKVGTTPAPSAQKLERVMFGLGCFWKSQHVFAKVPGVVRTRVGYSGGKNANPSYEQVCSHTTGHAEVVEVEYDPKKVTFEKLLDVFWSSHDPTTLNRQGPDFGDQYRSAVYFTTSQQRAEALKVKQHLELVHRFHKPIVTEIKPAATFYNAEDYHQDYYKKHGAVCF